MTAAFVVFVFKTLLFCAVAAVGMTAAIVACWAVVFAIGWVLYPLFAGLFSAIRWAVRALEDAVTE